MDFLFLLKRLGGWESSTVVSRFQEYARVMFQELGSMVSKTRLWYTKYKHLIIRKFLMFFKQ
jgi:beta-glucosidase/6-phospho-beta-glucosidase/beta-galactosidase